MIREELKKIWRPWMLAVLFLFGFIFYTIYLEPHISYFPKDPQIDGEFHVAKKWVQKYGTSLDSDEEAEVLTKIPLLQDEADTYIANFPLCKQNGLTTYKEFQNYYTNSTKGLQGELTDEQWDQLETANIISNYLHGDETNNIDGRIYATKNYTDFYKSWQSYGVDNITRVYDQGYTDLEYIHAKSTLLGTDEAWQNILPYEVPEETSTYFAYLLIWMILSVCLLLSPLLVRDRMRGIRSLQWSYKRGRKILNTQFRAAILSSFILTTINLLIFGGLFATIGTSTFAACRLFSFIHTGFVWVNWTYGIWCVVLIVLCYLTSMGVAALAFFLSQYSTNYVAMLLKLIPVVVVMSLICPKLISYAFYYNNNIYQATGIPGIEAILTVFIFLLGMILCAIAFHRQKKQDLVVS